MKYFATLLLLVVPISSYAQEIQAPEKPILMVFTNEKSAVGAVCPPCVQFAKDYRENVGGLKDFLTQYFSKYRPTGQHYKAIEWSGVTLGPLGGFDDPGLYRRFINHCPNYGMDRVQPIVTPTFWVLGAKGQWKEGYKGPDELMSFLRQYVQKPPTIVIPRDPDIPQSPQLAPDPSKVDLSGIPKPVEPANENTDLPVGDNVPNSVIERHRYETEIRQLLDKLKKAKEDIEKLRSEESSIIDKGIAIKDTIENVKEVKESFDDFKEKSEEEDVPWYYALLAALYPPIRKFQSILALVRR